ncbi:hypothetical protein SDC9_58127 [bioreactor metagenome]|uniref:Uncharacterized protein n=1 Tax=bioreactor metagenome TaxID=1076179 RepID=A0A644X6H8_9ZZZZ
MSIDQRIAVTEILGHPHHRFVDGTVTVGMVLTHYIPDDTCGFFVRFIGRNAQFAHAVKDTAMDRLESVTDVRQSPGYDNAHGIFQE